MRPKQQNSKRLFVIIGAALVLLAAVTIKGPGYVHAVFFDEFSARTAEPVAAVFNPADSASTRLLNMPHYTLFWKNTSLKLNGSDKLLALLKKGDAMITVETWLETYAGTQDGSNVLDAILNGKFDHNIVELAGIINKTPHTIYVRLNPDMEVPVYQFPWQYKSPELYIRAFNYVAAKLKRTAPAVKIVWGPSGFPGDTESWPGTDWVDMACITLGSQSEQSTQAYPYQPKLPEMLFSKLHRMRFIGKPVMVLGGQATVNVQFNLNWLRQQFESEQRNRADIYSPQNYISGEAKKPVRQKLEVGVFDPNRRLVNNPNISVEHIFTDWGEIERNDFKLKFDSIITRRHDAVVTVEPWRDTSKRSDANVLQSTLDGRYDKIIQKLYQIISNCGQTVYLRFAHEMEIPIHRYAWQSKNPVTYIKAYRYFMLADKIHANNIKRVWGPAGDRGSADWWPGSDVVDYISIAIYGLPDKNITDPNKQEPFSTIFERKYYRMRFLNRPLFITEFGVKGPEDYQRNWLMGAAKTLRANKHVFGICYFNLYDNPKAWGGIKAPDWSISPKNMQLFCRGVNE